MAISRYGCVWMPAVIRNPHPLPANNVLQIERHILGTDGKSKSLDSLRSGDLVLVWLQVKASNSVPDALVVDLLPAGLELENQNLANGSASSGAKWWRSAELTEPDAAGEY